MPPDQNESIYKYQKKVLDAATALAEYIGDQYNAIYFSNHWRVNDIRGFKWYNYHTPEKGMFDIGIAYTAIKDISTEDRVFSGLSNNRKADYKHAINRHKLILNDQVDHTDVEDFYTLYIKTFQRQNINLNDHTIEMVRNIVQTVMSNGYGRLIYAELSNGVRVAGQVCLYDERCAYYLFGANHPAYRSYGGGTFLLVEAMKYANQAGIKYFDFIGANSPLRGDFKLSFGAKLIPYYQIKMSRK